MQTGFLVLHKITSLSNFFAPPVAHPLLDAHEFKRILAELPQGNAFKALDEIAAWLESLQAAVGDVPLDRLYEVVQRLEEVAQPHLRSLQKDYLNSPRLKRADEKRLWTISFGFWTLLADAYERCLGALNEKGRVAEHIRASLPDLCARLIHALGGILKWQQFHYGPSSNDFWQRLGSILLLAEAAGAASRNVRLTSLSGASSPLREYQKVVLFQAASMSSLLPLEIELAERLIAHFLSAFVFSKEMQRDSVFWLDLQLAQPPQRLARQPERMQPTQLFFKPGPGHQALGDLLRALERGDDVPSEINFGAQYSAKTLIPVLRHLTAYLAPIPPQRKFDRHHVKHRVAVVHGLLNAFRIFSGEFGGRPPGLAVESWVVENVSRGGFGAVLSNISAEWLKVGALLAIQPEGGERWLLSVVRRYSREAGNGMRVGIETLAHELVALELKPRSLSRYAIVTSIPVLMTEAGCAPGDVLVVLPTGHFDLRESLEYVRAGQRYLLKPIVLQEQAADFQLARYRLNLGS